jgi:hypothetical protein
LSREVPRGVKPENWIVERRWFACCSLTLWVDVSMKEGEKDGEDETNMLFPSTRAFMKRTLTVRKGQS